MQLLEGTGRDTERQPAIILDSERHSATPWDRRGFPPTIGDS